MSDQPPRPERSMVDGLRDLANPGRGKDKPLDDYKAHLDLADPILRVLRVKDAVPPERRELLLRKVFADVAAQARAEAHAALSNAGSNPNKLLEPGKHPAFKSAAAGELLGCFDDRARERVRKKYVPDDSEWSKRFKGSDNTGELAYRRTYAGAWIGGQTHKNVGRPHKQIELFRAFEAALLVYVDQRREQLRAFVLEQQEPIKSDRAMTARAGVPTLAIPEVPDPPQRLASPAMRTPAPKDPELRCWIERLAADVRRQLNDEDGKDRITDPLPLPVRWSLTDEHPADQPINVWSEGTLPSLDAGTFDTITDLFESVPSGRLVILGKGGAGKTALARRLALGLLDRRVGNVVPVIFRLPSWDPTKKVSLRDWMVGRLIEDYPGLNATIQGARGPETLAAALMYDHHVLPILDGLDEVAPAHQSTALRWINRALRSGGSVVLTSRPSEYVAAVEAGGIVSRAAVIELLDLTPDDLAAYLPRTVRSMESHTDKTVWDSVLEQVRNPHSADVLVLAKALATPLMASLARSIYSETGADPTELLDTSRFPDAGAITGHLLDTFVEVKYDDAPPDQVGSPRRQWKPDDARRWLGFLAVMMAVQKTDELAWWRPGRYRMMRLLHWPVDAAAILATLFGIGMMFAAFLLSPGNPDSVHGVIRLVLIISAVAGIVMPGAIFLGAGSKPRELHKPMRWPQYSGLTLRTSWRAHPIREFYLFWATLASALLICFLTAARFFATVLFPRSAGGSFAFSVTFLITFSVSSFTFLGFPSVVSPGKTAVTTPSQVLNNDKRAVVATGLYYGGVISVICGTFWLYAGHPLWLVATPMLFVWAIIIAACLSSCGTWIIRSGGFALPFVRWLPRPSHCMGFLDDACTRGILRQVGGTYQFRHALLQERLATDFLDSQPTWVREHRTILYARSSLAVAQLASSSAPETVERELRDLIEEHRRRKNKHGVMWTWDLLIEALRRAGRGDDALKEATSLRSYMEDIGMKGAFQYWHYQGRRVLADLLVDAGRSDEAATEYAEALRLAENWWGQDDEDAMEIRAILAQLRD